MLEDFFIIVLEMNLFKSYFIMLLLYRFSANVCISEIKYLWTMSLENNLQMAFKTIKISIYRKIDNCKFDK